MPYGRVERFVWPDRVPLPERRGLTWMVRRVVGILMCGDAPAATGFRRSQIADLRRAVCFVDGFRGGAARAALAQALRPEKK